MKISIVIPTLNEEEGIAVTLQDIAAAQLEQQGHDVEILIVDGNSTDATREVAQKMGAKVIVEGRRGYGRAYKTGFSAATGDVIVTGDADGTYPFADVGKWIDHLQEENLDFITCNRYGQLHDGAMSGKHRLGNWVLSATARTLYWVRLRDSQSGMWIFRRNALAHIPYQRLGDGMPFSQEIKLHAMRNKNVRAKEVPSELRARVGEPVIESWRDGFGNLWALIRNRFKRQ